MMPPGGRAFVFGDGIDTDVLAPGRLMRAPPEVLARHCLEAVDPGFAGAVQPGDIVVAGRDFGIGSSREQAAVSLKLLGVSAVLAASFSRIFYRNAINLGLPVLVFPDAAAVTAGDWLSVDTATGRVENLSRGTAHAAEPIPRELREILEAGGLLPLLKRRLANTETAATASLAPPPPSTVRT